MLQGRLHVAPELAEDAVARAWLQLLCYQPGRDNVVGWLYTVAKHEAFRLLRAAKAEQPVDEIWPRPAAPPPEEILETRKVLAPIERLKPQQRTVLRLQIAGLSYKEMSKHTRQSYTWVNRHLTEGKQALRRLIEHEDA
jgi:RNA polymerase sigma factor (sigma-70 family)